MTKISILILSLFLIFPYINGQAQQDSITAFQIEYQRTLTPENAATTFHASYLLHVFIEPNVSLFDKLSVSENIDKLINDKDEETAFYYSPKGKNISLIFKDYTSNKLFSIQDITNKYFVVEDSLSIFDWQILDDTKDILGFTCQLAKTNFRGRNYEAWFTSELPIGGPWKYDGLPGMILALKEEGNFLTYVAVGIKNEKIKFTAIENPLNAGKTMSWQEYKDLYKKKAIALSKYNTESNSTSRVISPRMGIERYIEEEDMDYSADKEFEKQQEGNN